jgi:hypothetical protein
MSVYVAAERENAAIKSWDGTRLVLRGGRSIRLHGDQCLGCGGTEQVEARARSFAHSASSRLVTGLLIMSVGPKFVGPFAVLLGLAVIFSANHRARVTLPLCSGCALRGFAMKALGWSLGLMGFVACPVIGMVIGEVLGGRNSIGMTTGGFMAGLVVFLCLAKVWRSLLMPRVAVACVRHDGEDVTLTVPCAPAIDDMVARLDER